MAEASVSLNGDGTLALVGELKFTSVVAIRQQIEDLMKQLSGAVQIDFSAVTAVDSSALSLWLCCQRYAQSSGLQLSAVALPDELSSISRLVGLDSQI